MDINADALSFNLRRERQRRGLTQRRLAELTAGVISAATISRIEKGTVSSETEEFIPALAAALRVPIEKLTQWQPGQGPQSVQRELLEKFNAEDTIEVEYYEMATASASSLRHILASDPTGYRFMPNQRRFPQGRIKVIGVRGDCMEPSIHDGEDIYFDTTGELEEDVTVLAAVDDNTLVVKKLRARGDGWELAPANGEPAIALESEDRILGVVIGVWRPLF